MEEQKWYAIRAFPGYEYKVKDKLQKQIQIEKKDEVVSDIYIPVRKHYSFSRGKLKAKEELLFPGYIFVKMEFNNDTFYFVRGIQYVTGYAGISSMKQTPKPMKDKEYEIMVESVRKVTSDLKIGDQVLIVNHELYSNLIGVVKSIDFESEKLDLNLKDKNKVVTVLFSQIEKKK